MDRRRGRCIATPEEVSAGNDLELAARDGRICSVGAASRSGRVTLRALITSIARPWQRDGRENDPPGDWMTRGRGSKPLCRMQGQRRMKRQATVSGKGQNRVAVSLASLVWRPGDRYRHDTGRSWRRACLRGHQGNVRPARRENRLSPARGGEPSVLVPPLTLNGRGPGMCRVSAVSGTTRRARPRGSSRHPFRQS